MSNFVEEMVVVHWPGQDTIACPDHALKLRNLGAVIGCFVSSTPAPEGSECENCKNEKLKRESRTTEEAG